MKSIGGGRSTESRSAAESRALAGGLMNLPNCGWMRCTSHTVMMVNTDFLLSIGTTTNGTSYVIRGFRTNGFLKGEFLELNETVVKKEETETLREAGFSTFSEFL